jgi:hypothetical protein
LTRRRIVYRGRDRDRGDIRDSGSRITSHRVGSVDIPNFVPRFTSPLSLPSTLSLQVSLSRRSLDRGCRLDPIFIYRPPHETAETLVNDPFGLLQGDPRDIERDQVAVGTRLSARDKTFERKNIRVERPGSAKALVIDELFALDWKIVVVVKPRGEVTSCSSAYDRQSPSTSYAGWTHWSSSSTCPLCRSSRYHRAAYRD